jgi:hypothetical protein
LPQSPVRLACCQQSTSHKYTYLRRRHPTRADICIDLYMVVFVCVSMNFFLLAQSPADVHHVASRARALFCLPIRLGVSPYKTGLGIGGRALCFCSVSPLFLVYLLYIIHSVRLSIQNCCYISKFNAKRQSLRSRATTRSLLDFVALPKIRLYWE